MKSGIKRWTRVSGIAAAAALIPFASIANSGSVGTDGGSQEGITPKQLVDVLAKMRVGVTEQEASAFLAMSAPELVTFLEDQGLYVPTRLRRLGPDESPADVLTRDDLAKIVAPLASPSDEPKVTGISANPAKFESLLGALRSQFDGRHGLIRLAKDGSVVIPVLETTAADQRIATTMAENAGTSVMVENLTGLTYDELEALRDQVSTMLQKTNQDNWGVGILGDTQTVYVSLPRDATQGIQAQIESLAASAASRASSERHAGTVLTNDDVITIANGENLNTDSRDHAPQAGGKWIHVAGSTCTMGYVVIYPNAGARGMSAGHCAGVRQTGDSVYDANLNGSSDYQYYGPVIGNWFANNSPDIMTWSISSWDGHSRVFIGNGYKQLQGIQHESSQVMGTQICGTGWGIQHDDNTGQKCDSLDILNYTFTDDDDGISTPNTNCFERRTRGGDSGGPTYALDAQGRALAAGVTKGSHHTSFAGFDSYYWCYVTIDDALGVAGYTLPTGK